MKTLKESLLNKTKDKIETTKIDIDNYKYFGANFTFDSRNSAWGAKDWSMVNIRALRNITKGMTWKNPNGQSLYGGMSEKLQLFILWLDNIDLSSLDNSDHIDNKFLAGLWDILKVKVKEDGIFNKNTTEISVMHPNYRLKGFNICMAKPLSWNNYISLHFEENKL